MRIALYRGKSLFPSRVIEWLTWSPFSHAAWVFDAQAEAVAIGMVKGGADLKKLHYFSLGSCVEAWSGGVKNSTSVSALHTRGTPVEFLRFDPPLTKAQDQALITYFGQDIGLPYNYLGVLAFLTHVQNHGKSVFCSQYVASRASAVGRPLLARCDSRRVDPGMIDWSTELVDDGKMLTV